MDKKEKGWSSSTQVCDAHGVHIGLMICAKCGGKINKKTDKGLFLEVNHFNIFHRGNETEWNELFHRHCSADRNAWKKYEDDLIKEKERRANDLNNNRNVAIDKINKATHISFEDGDDENEILIRITK